MLPARRKNSPFTTAEKEAVHCSSSACRCLPPHPAGGGISHLQPGDVRLHMLQEVVFLIFSLPMSASTCCRMWYFSPSACRCPPPHAAGGGISHLQPADVCLHMLQEVVFLTFSLSMSVSTCCRRWYFSPSAYRCPSPDAAVGGISHLQPTDVRLQMLR